MLLIFFLEKKKKASWPEGQKAGRLEGQKAAGWEEDWENHRRPS